MSRRYSQRATTLAIVVLAWFGLGASCMVQTGEPHQWLKDYEALAQHLSLAYANLEWAVETGRVDLVQLDQETRTVLASTSSQRTARKAIERFVEAFGDPHLRSEKWQPGARKETSHHEPADPIGPEVSARDACKRMGFRGANLGFRIDFEALEGFEFLPERESNPFRVGILHLEERRVGLLRIAQFGPDRYEDDAIRLWEEYRAASDEPCDEPCQWEFWSRMSQHLLDALDERVRDLRDAGIDALAIDITRNGGGTDWAGIAPRILTSKPLRCPPAAFVKRPRERKRLRKQLTRLDSKLHNPVAEASARKLLTQARVLVQRELHEVEVPCDRMPLFRDADARLECSQLVRTSGCGMIDYLAPGTIEDRDTARLLYHPLRWSYREGVWDGPLYVIVDEHTASASEQFATLLQANDAAVIVGSRTYGAGCGYVGGGEPIELPNVGLRVHLPNCVRYRADGENELDGVEPDLTIWTEDDNDKQRARKLAAAWATLEH